ncbi:efflux RND transporter periplasmic adaptor subunit [Desulforhopalus singaporensis]|uniref:RND family efflux transporter, MFP subunit n=1 Tax=Desulforhopalus singaporensis TaxID=91360 RepID=A0A1H0SYM3_9BACT|nr:efflux RND transporter periplasmic adaptor subunit [Desulforhopalus singaporensis]SDP46903.1 RND family efflux transporter, MFP subunit [Desulforhopalus singaporensis]
MRILLTVIGVLLFIGSAPAQQGPPARVVMGQVMQQDVSSTLLVTGVLYYERVSDISSEVSGLVEEIMVRQGDHVEQGDLLVRLNTEILEKEIEQSRTKIERIELKIDNAGKNYRRIERLYDSSGVSEKDFDDAAYGYNDARKEKQAAEDNLEKLLITRRRSLIQAPFAGVVLGKEVDAGGWVQPGKVLVTIGSSSDLFVKAPIAEDLLRFVAAGQSVRVVLNAYGRELEGVVTGIDPVADLKTKNIFLKIRISPVARIAENMSVKVFVPNSERRQLSIFSRAAVVQSKGKDFVYTVRENKAVIIPVNIVAYLGDMVGVDSPGIQPGMLLVVEGNERLRPDQQVVVAGEN